MELRRLDEAKAERRTGPTFVNEIHRKTGFTEEFDDKRLGVNEIFFAPGERTEYHAHTIRQVLYITGGHGIVGTEEEEFEVSSGDLVSIPPDESHWHGAAENSTFSHISIVVRDEEYDGTYQVD